MIVVGIDPGTANTGYGVVARQGGRMVALDGGVVQTSPRADPAARLAEIHARVAELLDEHRPEALAVEELYFGANARSAIAVGQARGVVLLAAAQAEVQVREATPNEVKVAVAGYGAADKEQVARMVALVLSLDSPPTPDDAADALAVAICVANRERASEQLRSGALDRAATAPHESGRTPYDDAVREALTRERSNGGRRRPAGITRRG